MRILRLAERCSRDVVGCLTVPEIADYEARAPIREAGDVFQAKPAGGAGDRHDLVAEVQSGPPFLNGRWSQADIRQTGAQAFGFISASRAPGSPKASSAGLRTIPEAPTERAGGQAPAKDTARSVRLLETTCDAFRKLLKYPLTLPRAARTVRVL